MIVADDHHIVRRGLVSLLATIEQIDVVVEAPDGRDAVDLAERLRPDIVLMDISMPGLNGLEATRMIRSRCPEVKVLILSAYDPEAYVLQSIRSGANGYLLKHTSAEDLQAALLGLVAEGKELIASWKKQRPHLINLLLKHRDAEAEKYIEDVSGITYEKLKEILVYITEFSSSKAAFFAAEATRQSDAAIARFKWFLGGFVLLSLFAVGLTTLVVLRNLYQRDMKLVQKHERIEHLAHYDALTGLPNRALFFDRLRQTLLLAKRNEGGLALMYLDLDGFKQVNDQHGHHAGDLLLS